MKIEYVTLCGSVITTPNGGFDIIYGHDGKRFANRKDAIRNGFKLRDSDDFNVGVVYDGKLISVDWMEEPVDTDPEILKKIQDEIWL